MEVNATSPLLSIRNLSIGYFENGSRVPVSIVHNVNLTVGYDEVVGLVGESGSGKTQTARAILKINSRPLQPLGGHIYLDGVDLLALEGRELRRVRGGKISMIFQDPRSSLNPIMKIGDQLARIYALHNGISRNEARAAALDMLRRVGVAGPERVAGSYPHQLSGGMCQRVMIGLSVGIGPKLLIADEPTTGLDVTIQAQILELIQEAQRETGASMLVITHDLGVVAEICQRVAVMYAGRIVEIAPVGSLFSDPYHPYTRRLISTTLAAESLMHESAPPGEVADADADFVIAGQAYRASLVSAEDPNSGAEMVEVAPDHVVLCCSLSQGDSAQTDLKAGRIGVVR